MDLNKVMLIGNLTKDPEIKTTPSGISVVSVGLATNLTWTDQQGQKQQKAEFHNIVAWRKLAEIMGQYLKKGSKVYLEGRMQTRDWVGQDGIKRYRTEVIADNMIMLDSKGGGAPSGSGQKYPQAASSGEDIPVIEQEPAFNNDPANTGTPAIKEESEDEIKLEDIPF